MTVRSESEEGSAVRASRLTRQARAFRWVVGWAGGRWEGYAEIVPPRAGRTPNQKQAQQVQTKYTIGSFPYFSGPGATLDHIQILRQNSHIYWISDVQKPPPRSKYQEVMFRLDHFLSDQGVRALTKELVRFFGGICFYSCSFRSCCKKLPKYPQNCPNIFRSCPRNVTKASPNNSQTPSPKSPQNMNMSRKMFKRLFVDSCCPLGENGGPVHAQTFIIRFKSAL